MLPQLPRSRTPRRRRAGRRGAYTLLELVVVLTLLGIAAALVAPSIRERPRSGGTLEAVVSAARRTAIARAQSQSLAVSADGSWSLRPASPADSFEVTRGSLSRPPGRAVAFEIGALGSCSTSVPEGWNAALCRPLSPETRP